MTRLVAKIILHSVLVTVFMGCAKESEKFAGKRNVATQKSFHGEPPENTSAIISTLITDELKKKKLNADSTRTIGEAFDSYKFAIKKEWRETGTRSGKYYIDYICWLDVNTFSREGIVKRAVELKFVIHENGEAYIVMGTKVEIKSDGKLYSTPIEAAKIKVIVAAIYENKEISF